MAFNIDGKDCMISEWILLIVSFVFVGLRVYTRIVKLRRNLDLSDWLLIASAFDALGLIICDTLSYTGGYLDAWNPTVELSKISFASNYFYDFGMGFPKLSMLLFYWGYFRSDMSSGMRKVLWGMIAFVCACYITILWDDTFFCGGDVSVQWSQEEGACSVFYAPEPFIVNFTLNLACYLVAYAFPVILMMRGMLTSSKGLWITFALGTITIFSTIVRFVTLKVGTGQPNLVYPLSMLEMALAITVVALPGLKPLVGGAGHSHRSSSTDVEEVNYESGIGKSHR